MDIPLHVQKYTKDSNDTSEINFFSKNSAHTCVYENKVVYLHANLGYNRKIIYMKNEKNYCVIMAGGIGSRFWPISSKERPKQFLDFFGTGKSLLQMTVDRFRSLVPKEHIIVVTNVMYRDIVMEQIPDLDANQILCEPARRNTAPCIAYAIAHIKGVVFQEVMGRPMQKDEQVDWSDEKWNRCIVVSPSDHLILQQDDFKHAIEEGLEFVAQNDTLLTLGVTPTRPETGYGYIQMVLGEEKIKRVKTFTEKPNLDLAKVFYQSGEFVWNSGIFMWNIHAISQELQRCLPDMMLKFKNGEPYMGTDQEDTYIQEIFPTCPNISIDYGVMEKAKPVHVLTADFGWSDLGTWRSMYEVCQKDEQQNAILRGDVTMIQSAGNMVTVPQGNIAMIRGLKDFIVTQVDNILVICPRSEEEFVDKEIASIKSKDNL